MTANRENLSSWPTYSSEEVDAVARVLKSGRVNYWTGEECRKFEAVYAQHCGVEHAISLANGTVALELALEAAGIGLGDDVIVTPRTYIASASCVIRVGARPIFADVEPGSQNISPDSVRAALTPNTKAIIAVHLAGWPCDMAGLMALAEERDLVVIEDCAQAHGASIDDRPVGNFGHVSAFSFCQDKIITTGGEGGMLVTDDKQLWERAWAIKDHGKSYDAVFNRDHAPGFRWTHESFGTNLRMTEMQAAIGRIQLARLADWNAKRNDNARRITQTLAKYNAVNVPEPPANIVHAYYRLYAFIDPELLAKGWTRARIIAAINEQGVPCFAGSCPEVYDEVAFENDGLRPKVRMQTAELLGKTSLAFLVHPTLTKEDIDRVCTVLDNVLGRGSAS